jgi:hypothetical protein
MSARFTFTDNFGRVKEVEAFTVLDFSTTKKPGAPLRLDENGFLDPSLIDPQRDYGLKHRVEIFTLTQSQIDSKSIPLSDIPVSPVSLIPDGALPQRNYIDFMFIESDNSLTWAGLGLDGFLEVGETLEVSYFYK